MRFLQQMFLMESLLNALEKNFFSLFFWTRILFRRRCFVHLAGVSLDKREHAQCCWFFKTLSSVGLFARRYCSFLRVSFFFFKRKWKRRMFKCSIIGKRNLISSPAREPGVFLRVFLYFRCWININRTILKIRIFPIFTAAIVTKYLFRFSSNVRCIYSRSNI